MRNPDEIIQAALGLDGKADTLQKFYAKWATFYNEDVANEAYTAPKICVDLLLKYRPSMINALEVLDAGCGTGLIGKVLQERGVEAIDGFDLSHEMIVEAKKVGAYQNLAGGVDLNKSLSHLKEKKYDAVFCCGVFTLGHVPPESLENLFAATHPNGLVITSTRTRYYEDSNYQWVSDHFVAQGRVELLEVLKDAPYTTDDNSHYWVYRVG